MKLIEAEKVERTIKDYWKAQVDRLPIPKNIEEHDAYANRLGTILEYNSELLKEIEALPSIQPERKTGHWILDRSGAYCCSKCMEPCAGYVMMKPRDKFCKMCGSRNEVTE